MQLRLLSFSLLLLSIALQHYIIIFSGFSEIPGDLGDARLVHYLLEFTYQSLLNGSSIWNPNYFYPASNVGAFTDVLPGVLPWYAVFRILGLDFGLSFQLWLITTTMLNFLCAVYFFNSFKSDRWLSLIAAFLFTIASPRAAQLVHPQLLFAGFSLIFLGALLSLTNATHQTEIRKYILIASFAFLLQCYSGFYNTWGLAFICTTGVAVCAFFRHARGNFLTPLFRNIFQARYFSLLALGIISLCLLPLYLHAKAAALDVGYRPFGEVHAALPRILAWFNQGPFSFIYSGLSELTIFSQMQVEHENRLGIGLVSTALFLIGAWKLRNNRYTQTALTGFVFICCIITVLPTGFSIWSYFYLYFPGAAAVRAVSRVALVLSIIPCFFISYVLLQKLRQGGRSRLVGILALLIVSAEQVQTEPAYDKLQSQKDIEQIVNFLKSHQTDHQPGCPSFILVVKNGKFPSVKYHIDAMWAALLTGIPTLNGYSGNYPPGWELENIKVGNSVLAASIKERAQDWQRIANSKVQFCTILKQPNMAPMLIE